jgi:hypothetical protein
MWERVALERRVRAISESLVAPVFFLRGGYL